MQNMHLKHLILYLFVAIAVPYQTHAQKITVNARLDSTMIMIGNQAHLTYEISQQPNQKVIIPIFTDSVPGGLELADVLKIDTTKTPDGRLLVKQHYTVTGFNDSLYYIPAFPFILNGDTVWSKSLSLKVVQPYKIDTVNHTIADIKPVFNAKIDWLGIFKIVGVIWLLALLSILGYLYFRKYFKKKPVLTDSELKLLLPAHVVALNCLDKIKQEKLWQQDRPKEYHTELTDVIREYIERIFNINSMEMTSEENWTIYVLYAWNRNRLILVFNKYSSLLIW